jgi:hypothetical protein
MIYYNNSTFEALFDNNPEEKEIYNLFEEEQEPLSTEKEKENILNTNIIDEKHKLTTIESPHTSFSTNKIDKIIDEPKKYLTPALKKRRGRTKTENNDSKHNKFSDDKMRRKTKHIIFQEVMNFINEKIYKIYGSIGQGIFIKKLLIINQKQLINSNILFNKHFMNKTLGEIFSENISNRYTNYPPEHNKYVIEKLINDEDEIKRNYFKKLFNLKFIDCIRHFRESCLINELVGLTLFKDLKLKSEMDEDYRKALKYYIYNYENIILNKKERNLYKNTEF